MPMSGRHPLAILKSPRLWLLGLAILALPLLAEFNARLTLSRQLASEEAALTQQIDTEKARQQELLKLKDYVNSDNYVEDWARQARMARPGEVAVVPSPEQARTPAPTTTLETTGTPNDVVSEWWATFFGDAPQNP